MILGGAVVTLLLRFPSIFLYDRMGMPVFVRKSMRFVPAAVLPALIVPAVLLPEGSLFLSIHNYRIFAAIVAGLVTRRTNNVFLTIIVAMGVYFSLQLLGPKINL